MKIRSLALVAMVGVRQTNLWCRKQQSRNVECSTYLGVLRDSLTTVCRKLGAILPSLGSSKPKDWRFKVLGVADKVT